MAHHFPPKDLIPSAHQHDDAFLMIPKLINGGVAGVISTALMFPLDLVKTRIQNQIVGSTGEKIQKYSSVIDTIRKILKSEGIKGLYRGCMVNTALIAPEKAIKLVTNDLMRYYLKPVDKPIPFSMEILAAATAGCAQNILTTPMDLLKINLQQEATRGKSAKRITARQLAVDIYKNNGILGFYKGAAPTVFRNVSFSIFYFPVFFYLNNIGPKKENNPKETKSYWTFISACGAGAIGAAVVTPFDVIKTRIQSVKTERGESKVYSGTLDAFVKIFKNEGPLALMKGSGIRMIVIAPLFGILQVIYFLGVGEYVLGLKK